MSSHPIPSHVYIHLSTYYIFLLSTYQIVILSTYPHIHLSTFPLINFSFYPLIYLYSNLICLLPPPILILYSTILNLHSRCPPPHCSYTLLISPIRQVNLADGSLSQTRWPPSTPGPVSL